MKKREPKLPRHVKKGRDHKFGALVDKKLFFAANAKRTKSWPELVEQMLRLTAAGTSTEAVLNTLIRVLLDLKSEIKSEYEGAPRYTEFLKEIQPIETFIAKVQAAL